MDWKTLFWNPYWKWAPLTVCFLSCCHKPRENHWELPWPTCKTHDLPSLVPPHPPPPLPTPITVAPAPCFYFFSSSLCFVPLKPLCLPSLWHAPRLLLSHFSPQLAALTWPGSLPTSTNVEVTRTKGKKMDIHWIFVSFQNKIKHVNLIGEHQFLCLAPCFYVV